jgi:hypothetical protein
LQLYLFVNGNARDPETGLVPGAPGKAAEARPDFISEFVSPYGPASLRIRTTPCSTRHMLMRHRRSNGAISVNQL